MHPKKREAAEQTERDLNQKAGTPLGEFHRRVNKSGNLVFRAPLTVCLREASRRRQFHWSKPITTPLYLSIRHCHSLSRQRLQLSRQGSPLSRQDSPLSHQGLPLSRRDSPLKRRDSTRFHRGRLALRWFIVNPIR